MTQTDEQLSARIVDRDAFYPRRMGETKRWHASPMMTPSTVGLHTFNVLRGVMTVLAEPSTALMRYALYHDAVEYLTGDVPRYAKTDETRERDERLLSEFGRLQLFMLPERSQLDPKELAVFEFMDYFDAVDEMACESYQGNRRMAASFVEQIPVLNKKIVDLNQLLSETQRQRLYEHVTHVAKYIESISS